MKNTYKSTYVKEINFIRSIIAFFIGFSVWCATTIYMGIHFHGFGALSSAVIGMLALIIIFLNRFSSPFIGNENMINIERVDKFLEQWLWELDLTRELNVLSKDNIKKTN